MNVITHAQCMIVFSLVAYLVLAGGESFACSVTRVVLLFESVGGLW